MMIMKGASVSSGIAIGKAKIIKKEVLHITRKYIKDHEIKTEVEKFENSITHVLNEIDLLIKDISQSKVHTDILTTHKMILIDPEFTSKIKRSITEKLMSMEHAVSEHFDEIVNIFNDMDNDYLSQRSSDYEDVAYRLLSYVLDKRTDRFGNLDENSVLIMEDISPSAVTKIFAKNICGLCTEKGSKNAHSSIIARSMNLPMLVAVHGLLENVKENDNIIIDGNTEKVIISPDKKTLGKYSKKIEQQKKEGDKLKKVLNFKAETSDGKRIKLMSNIEIPEEIDQVIKNRSEGIGLFRTEFLFMDADEFPTEEQQFQIYRKIAEKCAPEPVVIRTIDLGGDKLSNLLNIGHELNPNLGCRGIRISLEYVSVFKTQIKAILRANMKDNVKMMFPMISCVSEVLKAKMIIEECKNELKEQNISFNPEIGIGAMIEIPSAAITSDDIAKECDFLSIGTNDLVQYTLAVDRDNETVSDYYQPSHLSVLRLIKMTIENAHLHNIKVAVCGEMASEKKYIKLLIGLGIDELSVSPGRLLMIKNEILQTDLGKAEELVRKIFNALEDEN